MASLNIKNNNNEKTHRSLNPLRLKFFRKHPFVITASRLTCTKKKKIKTLIGN